MFNTKELYVGKIGEICYDESTKENKRSIEKTNDYIIFEITKYPDGKQCAKDVLTNRKYVIWSLSSFDDVKDLVGHKAIYHFNLIEKYLTFDITSVLSIADVKRIYFKFKSKSISDDDDNYVTNSKYKDSPNDLVLKIILYLNDLIEKNINGEVKEELKQKLCNIANDYTKSIVEFMNNKSNNKCELTDIPIKQSYLTQLLMIELEIKKHLNINDFDNEFNNINRILNKKNYS